MLGCKEPTIIHRGLGEPILEECRNNKKYHGKITQLKKKNDDIKYKI